MRLPWHVVMRADGRATLTASGIAIVVAFAAIGSTIPAALHTEAIAPEGELAAPDAIVSRPDASRFEAASLAGLRWGLATKLVPGEEGIIVVATAVGPEAPAVGPGEAIVDADGRWRLASNVSLWSGGREIVLAPRPVRDAPTGHAWLLVAPEVFALFDPAWTRGSVDHAVLARDAADLDAIEDAGLVVTRAPAADRFFAASAREVARDLLLVVLYSSLLVALFSYEFLRSEVWEKRREIGLWRGLGLTRRGAFVLLLGRSAAISTAGALAGFAAAILFVHAAGRATTLDALPAAIHPLTFATLALGFVTAGVVGAATAAFTASRLAIREAMEGPA